MLTPGEVVFNRKQQKKLSRMLGVGGGPDELFQHVSKAMQHFQEGGVAQDTLRQGKMGKAGGPTSKVVTGGDVFYGSGSSAAAVSKMSATTVKLSANQVVISAPGFAAGGRQPVLNIFIDNQQVPGSRVKTTTTSRRNSGKRRGDNAFGV